MHELLLRTCQNNKWAKLTLLFIRNQASRMQQSSWCKIFPLISLTTTKQPIGGQSDINPTNRETRQEWDIRITQDSMLEHFIMGAFEYRTQDSFSGELASLPG